MNIFFKYSGFKIKRLLCNAMQVGMFCFMMSAATAQQNLVVIANQQGPPSSISRNQLNAVFMGEKQRWSNGTKITLALIKTSNPLGVAISSKLYDMRPDELNKYFLALVFQGKLSAPFFFNSTAELHEFVAHNPGAIGITDANINTPDIKTLVVDGKTTL